MSRDRFAAPTFGVSHSRLRGALDPETGCLRWYWWKTYGSWKGWESRW